MPAKRLRRRSVLEFHVLDRAYVLYRDARGEPVAVPDACPHRGAKLSRGRVNASGELVCGYHGWRIRSDGSARSAAVRNKACRIPRLKTWERHGYIWVAHDDVADDAFPSFLRPGYQLAAHFPMPFAAPLRVAVDNFSEVEHAFAVHTFIGPDEAALDTAEFRSETHGDETLGYSSARNRSLPLGLSRLLGVQPGDRYHNDWAFRFKPLQGSYHNYWTSPAGDRRPISFVVTTFFVPTANGQAVLHTFLQLAIRSRWLDLLRPLIALIAALVTRYEIWADARIARFAPDPDATGARPWQLTRFDKQVMVNRRLIDQVYFGEPARRLRALPIVREAAAASNGESRGEASTG